MLISHIHRFIYLKTIKTGGTSVEIYFERYCVNPAEAFIESHEREEEVSKWGIIGSRLGDVVNQRWYNPLPGWRIREMIGAEMWNSYYKFCVIRSPFDKVVSLFWHQSSIRDRAELRHSSFLVCPGSLNAWAGTKQMHESGKSIFALL